MKRSVYLAGVSGVVCGMFGIALMAAKEDDTAVPSDVSPEGEAEVRAVTAQAPLEEGAEPAAQSEASVLQSGRSR